MDYTIKTPFIVCWGNNPRYLFKELSDIIGYKEKVSKDRSLKTVFKK